jgi:hypothetical protein
MTTSYAALETRIRRLEARRFGRPGPRTLASDAELRRRVAALERKTHEARR